MQYVILFDFGSTFTKAAVVCKDTQSVIFTTRHPSTVKVDAKIAMEQCLADIRAEIGEDAVAKATKHASSSAAGGLRIVVVGLTHNLSLSAGRNVAFGAGAKIIHLTTGKLTEAEVEKIEELPAEMILLCGGYENGNTTIVKHNVEMLAHSGICCPVIYGGNSAIAMEVRAHILQHGKECFLAPNIIPEVGVLDVEVAEEIIRHLFMHRIVNMKGLGDIIEMVEGDITPTPAAVLDAGMLLSKGDGKHAGIGELMVVDIGGATTDIHSFAEHNPFESAKMVGANEPFAKRTVEGDLGMRESSDLMMKELGLGFFAEELGIDEVSLEKSIKLRTTNTEFLPDTDEEKHIDQIIAESAAYLAARRHAGTVENLNSKYCRRIQHGKNLTHVKTVIGTGGPIINSTDPKAILQHVIWRDHDKYNSLLPHASELLVDEDYILYAVGLLSYVDKELAYSVGINSLKKQ